MKHAEEEKQQGSHWRCLVPEAKTERNLNLAEIFSPLYQPLKAEKATYSRVRSKETVWHKQSHWHGNRCKFEIWVEGATRIEKYSSVGGRAKTAFFYVTGLVIFAVITVTFTEDLEYEITRMVTQLKSKEHYQSLALFSGERNKINKTFEPKILLENTYTSS